MAKSKPEEVKEEPVALVGTGLGGREVPPKPIHEVGEAPMPEAEQEGEA